MAVSPGKITDKIAMMGEGGVGKTSLTINVRSHLHTHPCPWMMDLTRRNANPALSQLTMHHFTETYDPTLEDSYRRQCVIDGVPAHMEILDTAGQEEYGALREQWIRQNDLFVIVYDVTRRSSFEATERLFGEVMDAKRKLDAHDFTPALVVLVGNKCDLDARRLVGTVEGATLAKRLGCAHVETSAKLGTNVEKAFFTVVRADRRRRAAERDAEAKDRSDEPSASGSRPQRTGKLSFFQKINNLLHRD